MKITKKSMNRLSSGSFKWLPEKLRAGKDSQEKAITKNEVQNKVRRTSAKKRT